MSSAEVELSKFLSLVLRHKPQVIGLTLDADGWADVETLLDCAKRTRNDLDRELLMRIVRENDKQRFTLSPDGLRIRAAQGHTLACVAINYPCKEPPETLYHGTAERFLAEILRHGLTPQKRQHVHLSQYQDTAAAVGARYGKPIVLIIPAALMRKDGQVFYQAENGVWLVDRVAPHWLLKANPQI